MARERASSFCPNPRCAKRERCSEAWPEEAVDNSFGLYSLHHMFDIVGSQLTHRDVRVLSFLFVDVIDEYERGGIRCGRDFLLALERQGRCDETNFRHVLQLLRIITRHDLLPYVSLRKRQAGENADGTLTEHRYRDGRYGLKTISRYFLVFIERYQ